MHWRYNLASHRSWNALFPPDGQARIRAVSHETRSAVPSIVRTGIVA